MDYRNPGSAQRVIQRHTCPQVLMELLQNWPEVPDEAASSGLLGHLCQCSHCISRLIALEAAFDLAEITDVPCP